MQNKISRFFARRELRKKVDWKDCAWSPQKAAEKRFMQMLVEQRMALFKAQIKAYEAQWLDELKKP
jgi:hypothetical protein